MGESQGSRRAVGMPRLASWQANGCRKARRRQDQQAKGPYNHGVHATAGGVHSSPAPALDAGAKGIAFPLVNTADRQHGRGGRRLRGTHEVSTPRATGLRTSASPVALTLQSS